MSLHLTCQWCGQEYTTGVVGNMPVGSGHICEVRQPCHVAGCTEAGRFLTTPFDQENETWNNDGPFQFSCSAHLEPDEIVLMTGGKKDE